MKALATQSIEEWLASAEAQKFSAQVPDKRSGQSLAKPPRFALESMSTMHVYSNEISTPMLSSRRRARAR